MPFSFLTPFHKGGGGILGPPALANPPSPPFAKGGMEHTTENCMTLTGGEIELTGFREFLTIRDPQ
jgi:hypothetical protein